jgi:O-antigen/teichoic acid export membrane protein
VPLGFVTAGLRGACLGLLGAEVITFSAAAWWAGPYLHPNAIDLSRRHLAPFLRISGLFAVGNLLLTLTQRSGETLVRFATNSYEEIGYFGAAYAVYLTVAQVTGQLVSSLAPHLIGEFERGRVEATARWLEQTLKYMVAVGVLAVAGATLLGRTLVPMLLGGQYAPAADNVTVMTLALVTGALGAVVRLQALMLDRPRAFIVAAAVECAAFWAIGFPLARQFGSFGASLAVAPASALYAWFLTANLRPRLRFSFRPAARALAASIVFAPLILLSPAWPLNVVLYSVGAAAYIGLLLRLRVVTLGELTEVRRILRLEGPAAAPDA